MCTFEGECMPEFIAHHHHIVHVRTNAVLNAHMYVCLSLCVSLSVSVSVSRCPCLCFVCLSVCTCTSDTQLICSCIVLVFVCEPCGCKDANGSVAVSNQQERHPKSFRAWLMQ
jgi:hypothetical protein